MSCLNVKEWLRGHRRLRNVLLVVLVVAILFASGIVSINLSNSSAKNSILLRSGDVLFYSATQVENGETKVFTLVTTLDYYGEDGYTMGQLSPGGIDLPSDVKYLPEPMLKDAGDQFGNSPGMYLSNDRIQTTLGEKCVSTYVTVNSGYMVIRDFGQQSDILYRKIIYKEGYQLTIQLNGTYNRDVWDADPSFTSGMTDVIGHVSDMGTTYICSPGSSMWSYGVLQVKQGEKVHYILSGDNSTVQIYQMNRIAAMTDQGTLAPVPYLSMPYGTEGEVNATAEEGYYLCVIWMDEPSQDAYIQPFWN
jgi:hypothetical protein